VAQFLPERVINTLEATGTRIGEAAKALTPVLEDLHEALVKRAPSEVDRVGGPQGNLSSAMARFDATLKHWNDVLGDPQTKSRLKDAINNVHTITEDGKAISADLKSTAKEFRGVVDDTKAFVAEGRDTVRSIKTEVTDLGRGGRSMFESVTRLLDSAHEVTSAVSRGEGTLGHLVRDAKLYEAMVLSFERGAKALEDFRLLVQDWLKGKIRVAF
jgi:methyl-accepting chemotaxis protein